MCGAPQPAAAGRQRTARTSLAASVHSKRRCLPTGKSLPGVTLCCCWLDTRSPHFTRHEPGQRQSARHTMRAAPHHTSTRPCAGPLTLSAGAREGRFWRKRARTGHTAPAMPCAAALHRCPTSKGKVARAAERPERPPTTRTPQDGHGSTEGGQCTELRSMHARVSAARLPCGSLVERPHRSACGSRRQCASGRSAGSSLRSASPQAAVVARFASTRPGGRHRPHLLGTALAC